MHFGTQVALLLKKLLIPDEDLMCTEGLTWKGLPSVYMHTCGFGYR